jgi:hypothetical protein
MSRWPSIAVQAALASSWKMRRQNLQRTQLARRVEGSQHLCSQHLTLLYLRSDGHKTVAQTAPVIPPHDARVRAVVLHERLVERVLVYLVANVAAEDGNVL